MRLYSNMAAANFDVELKQLIATFISHMIDSTDGIVLTGRYFLWT